MATNRHSAAINRYVARRTKDQAKALGKELEREFQKLEVESERELIDAARDAEKRMRITVWRDTEGERSEDSKKYGPISKTIHVNKGRDERGFFVDFLVGAFYARFQEYGTVHQPPRPRFRPAVAQAVNEFQRKK